MAIRNENVRQDAWVRGALAGLVGGLAFAAYSMIASAADGLSAWWPANLVAAIIPAYRPAVDGFMAGPSLVGMGIHLIVSALWGALFGYMAMRAVRTAPQGILWGVALGLVAYLVTGILIGPAADPSLRLADPFNYFLGHMIYGVATGWSFAGMLPRAMRVAFFREEARVEARERERT